MAEKISKSQIDRLGDRLKKGNISENDLRMLDQYRRSYSETYELVVEAIRTELSLAPTGRPAKSTPSIAEKLRRESIRLTQIQDIAGCRIIVADIASQEIVVKAISDLFKDVTIIDRRQQPSHGYRAVHLVVRYNEKLIEVQVRTALQQLWAELSEKFSDVSDPMIKYGGGDEIARATLMNHSSLIATEELLETKITSNLREDLDSIRQQMLESLRDVLKGLEILGRK